MTIRTRQHIPDNQLALFTPRDWKALGRFALPAEKMEKQTVSALRNLILNRAKRYYENMKTEFNHKYLKPRELMSRLQGWPEGEKWEWPSERMHQKLKEWIEYELRIIVDKYQPDKKACLRWAEYDRQMIERLGVLDSLLRTGDFEGFFKMCEDKKGAFWTDKKLKSGERRVRLDARWPTETTTFLTLKLEIKQGNTAPF